MINFSLVYAFGFLSCPYWSTVLQCGTRPPIHTLNNLTVFFSWGCVWVCIPHRRSVAVLCMLHKSRCNPMHSLHGALPVPYVLVWVTRDALVPYEYTNAVTCCRNSFFISFALSLWNDLGDLVFDGVGMAGLNHRAIVIYWPKQLFLFLFSTIFQFPVSLSLCWYCGAGVFGLIWC